MLRFSIARLMLLVGMVAVFLAAAVAGALPFAIVVLATTTIAAFRSRGSARAFFVGFSATGWAYLLLAFGFGPSVRLALPTTRPIVHVYDAVKGSTPPVFKTQEEAEEWIRNFVVSVHQALAMGHGLLALLLALVGGLIIWLIAKWQGSR